MTNKLLVQKALSMGNIRPGSVWCSTLKLVLISVALHICDCGCMKKILRRSKDNFQANVLDAKEEQ